MKKMFAGLVLAAVTLFSFTAYADHHHPRWGSFYTDDVSVDLAANEGVEFESQDTSDGLFLDSADATKIIIQYPGTYLVTYAVTAINGTGNLVEFALSLNEGVTYVPGSLFAAREGYDGDVDSAVQLYGQALVHVTHGGSTLQLLNVIADTDLVSIAEGATTASVVIHRIDAHNN